MASICMSFLDVVDHTRTMEKLHREARGVDIRGLASKVSTVVLSPMVGAFQAKVSMIIIPRGSLDDQFRSLFGL